MKDGGGDHHAAESAEGHDGDLGHDPFWVRSTKDDCAHLRWENKAEPSKARDSKRVPTRYEVFYKERQDDTRDDRSNDLNCKQWSHLSHHL